MSEVKELEKKLDKRFDDLTTLMGQFADDTQTKLAEYGEEFRKLNKKYDHLITTIDSFIGRIDNYETELDARDHKIARLERWIEQIADKTGTKLT